MRTTSASLLDRPPRHARPADVADDDHGHAALGDDLDAGGGPRHQRPLALQIIQHHRLAPSEYGE
jgi:hypothetical protein